MVGKTPLLAVGLSVHMKSAEDEVSVVWVEILGFVEVGDESEVSVADNMGSSVDQLTVKTQDCVGRCRCNERIQVM